MKMILFASMVAIALASCANPVQTSANAAAWARSPECARLASSPDGGGPMPTPCPYVSGPSYANPTGQVTHGPHGEISLYSAHSGGSG